MSNKLYFNMIDGRVRISGRIEHAGVIGDINQLLAADDPMPVEGLTFDKLKAADYGVITVDGDGGYTIGPIETDTAP